MNDIHGTAVSIVSVHDYEILQNECDMDKVESLVDAKLCNAKISLMDGIREQLKDDLIEVIA